MDDHQNRLIKKDKKRIILTSMALFILFSSYQNISAQNSSEEKANQIKLIRILEKTREYCSRLKNAAFYYVCLEEVSEKINVSREFAQNILTQSFSRENSQMETRFKTPIRIIENKYIYDYQLVQKDYKTEERRILLEENGAKRNEKDAPLKTVMFKYQKVLFGPIDVLSGYWQYFHDYKIVSEEMLHGEKTVVIEATPKPFLKQRRFFGKIWVKEGDFSILKIEWSQKSIGNFQILEDIAKRYNSEPQITLVSEYNIERNGIKFPSRYLIEEAYINKRGNKFIRSEIIITYRDYKFFIVETDIKY